MPEESQIVQLSTNFYRDCFTRVVILIIGMVLAIGLLLLMSFYLRLNKPAPVTFPVYDEWRVVPDIPVDQPYLATPAMLSWVGQAIPNILNYDFINYNDQLKAANHYFTDNGWNVFSNQLNIYVNYNTVQDGKMFVNGYLDGAPVVLNQGLLSGRYAWWVQVPIVIDYAGYRPVGNQRLTLQILVVRVSTLDNLSGLAIDNVIVAKKSEEAT